MEMNYVALLCAIVFQVVVGEEAVERIRRSTGLIVNGEDAGRGTFPEFAWILVGNSFYCGGTILDSRTILTAAHCATERARSYSVIVGKYRYNSQDETEQSFGVSRVISHGAYNFPDNDIALFRLNGDITFNDLVKPATIAKNKKMESNKTLCYAVGAGAFDQSGGSSGSPTVLQKILTNIIGIRKCKRLAGRELDLPGSAITKNVVCTYDKNAGVCFGDSGGPVGCYNDMGKFIQMGLLSFGSPVCVDGFNVFTRVARYRKWIKNNK